MKEKELAFLGLLNVNTIMNVVAYNLMSLLCCSCLITRYLVILALNVSNEQEEEDQDALTALSTVVFIKLNGVGCSSPG